MKLRSVVCSCDFRMARAAGARRVRESPPPQPAASPRPLVAPASLGSERVVNQVVRGAFGARELTFNCVVTVKDGAMTLVGMNSLGRTALHHSL